ncbi:MAG: 1-acyl-sn-glycerol-3-phosphate acyltransferase, partial [Actinomycetota bacterium]|nr:1-acyl-sn-glycerol-3-phosphate acyltransferase [Actinomycetota bacterium]
MDVERRVGHVLYDGLAAVFRLGFRLFRWSFDARGQQHIPSTGPVIVASNHISYLDFSFVALCQRQRRIRYMVRSDVMHTPVVGAALRALRQIEIDPYGDARPGYRDALAALRAGEVVGIFPEGTISPSFVPMEGRPGAARLAAAAGAPIVPVAVWGSQRVLTKGRDPRPARGIPILVRYGEPLLVERRADSREATDELMARIEHLLKQAQDDYPDQPAGPDDRWWVPAHLGGTAPTVDEA